MGVIGIGIDIVHIPRIQQIFLKYGDRFLNRAYHKEEIEEFRELERSFQKQQLWNWKPKNKLPDKHFTFLASRWAMKEATHKSIGGVKRLPFPEIQIKRNSQGKPELVSEGFAAKIFRELGVSKSLISISHDGEYAIANIVLHT